MDNSIGLLGFKRIISKKDGREWTMLHCIYHDGSYDCGLACQTLFVSPSVINGQLKEKCKLEIVRSPDGRTVLEVKVINS